MSDMFSNLNTIETFYMICAATGGSVFFVKLLLQFLGGSMDFDGDVPDADIDVDIDTTHVDSDVSFKTLTLHGLSAFFMMFGLVGFALYRASQVGSFLSLIGACAAGAVTVWVIGKLFEYASKLQSSGTVENVSAIGAEGKVYLTIPAGGTGRVLINFKNRFREFDAVGKDKEIDLKTGERIKVVWVDGNVLVVEKI
jgi:membrane protein implicated in regulation of membrane protease activity